VRQVPEMPEVPGVPDSDAAGLRAANARLRELLAHRDAEVAVLREQLAVLQSQVADLAARVQSSSRNSSKPPSSDGLALNAARRGKLQQKRHALATRMQAREDDYLRFARDLRVPFDNNEAERAIRMSKLRIKVSGCMRSMAGAGEFCAIRSYLATAARHDISALDALAQAFQGNPWIPETG
jgi:hypothetical protein